MSLIWIVNILSVFFLCVFFAGIVIPQILLIAFRRRLFDEPDERKIHQCVVPRLGGMAFKPVVFFSFVLLLAVNVSTGHDELLKEIGAEALPLAYAFCAIIMLYLVGIADDLIGVRYRAKFFIQIVCGIMLVAGGVELSDLHGMLFIHSMPSWISILSGGEIIKLLLAKMLMGRYNILLMDEPSNFLDIPSLEALEILMKEYAGTIVFITHDKRLLENVADVVYEIRDKKINLKH